MLKFLAVATLLGLATISPTLAQGFDDYVPPHDTLKLGKARFPKGVYLTLQEFIKRDPSYLETFHIDSVTDMDDIQSRGRSGDIRLSSVNGLKDKDIPEKVFAVCTEDALYINARTIGPALGFRRVVNQGPIWYMITPQTDGLPPGTGRAVAIGALAGVATGALGAGIVMASMPTLSEADVAKYQKWQGLAFNEKTWRFHELDPEGIRALLATEPVLLGQLEQEAKPRSALEKYVLYRHYVDLFNADMSQ